MAAAVEGNHNVSGRVTVLQEFCRQRSPVTKFLAALISIRPMVDSIVPHCAAALASSLPVSLNRTRVAKNNPPDSICDLLAAVQPPCSRLSRAHAAVMPLQMPAVANLDAVVVFVVEKISGMTILLIRGIHFLLPKAKE